MIYIIIIIIVANLAAFSLMGLDKRAARASAQRTPERVFYNLALLGGGMGVFAGALTFHHKTRKAYFLWLTALATLLHIYVVVAIVVVMIVGR